jgi:hypothetical protein
MSAIFAGSLQDSPSAFARPEALVVYGDDFAFTVEEPTQWMGDTQSAAQWGANIIFYKQGRSPSDAGSAVIRIGVFDKADEDTAKDLEADMNRYRSKYPKVAFKDIDGIKSHYKAWPRLFYVPQTLYEYVTYLNPGPERRLLISISMNTKDAAATPDELRAYQAVIRSFVLLN